MNNLLEYFYYFFKYIDFKLKISDFNECDSDNFGCSNNCVNTLGSAFCSCPQGFQLQADQKTCSGEVTYKLLSLFGL